MKLISICSIMNMIIKALIHDLGHIIRAGVH